MIQNQELSSISNTEPVDSVDWLLKTRNSICYSPPSIFLDFRHTFCLISKKKENYLVLAIHWFDMYQNNYSPVSVNSGGYFPCGFAAQQMSTRV